MTSPNPRASMESLSSTISASRRGDYPFPRVGGRPLVRRGSTASSINSVAGSIDVTLTVSESDQNAISTLLQPPIVRTGLVPHTSAPPSSTHKPPTSRDIPPVVLTNIPTVDLAEFKPYLSQVGSLYEALQRAKDKEDEGDAQFLRRGSKQDEISELLGSGRRSPRPSLSTQPSLVSVLAPLEAPSSRKKGGQGKRSAQTPTPLSTIPGVYLEENFHLENPRTFDIVSERSEVVRPAPGSSDERKMATGISTGPRKALATNAILQEKLSWYMDTVEVHLISSISTASTSFFAALGSLRDLHSETAESVERIRTLRRELDMIDQDLAVGGLNILQKKRRRENLRQLGDVVQQLKLIVESLGKCEALVNKSEVESALDAIDGLEKLMSGKKTNKSDLQFQNLKGAVALEGVTTTLSTLRLRVSKTIEVKFLDVLLEDLRSHVEAVSTPDILQRWHSLSQRSRGGHNRQPSAYPSYLSVKEEFRTELFTHLSNLFRAKHASQATSAYRESILREIRRIVRRPLPTSNDDDAASSASGSTIGGERHKSQQEKSAILANHLKALDPQDAEDVLQKAYISVGETLRRLGTQEKTLLDLASRLGDPDPQIRSPPMSPQASFRDIRPNSGHDVQEEMHRALDSSNLLGEAVDIAQDKIVKILKVRSEQSTHLSVERFLRYFNLNKLFAIECEAVSGRSGTILKNLINAHIKEFLSHLGDSERQKLATGMESDNWNAKDFTDEDKEYLSHVLSASTQDAEAWSKGSKIWLPCSPSTDLPMVSNGTSTLLAAQTNGIGGGASGTFTPTPGKDKVRSAVIEEESYILPVSAILCLRGLSQFLHLNTGIPGMTFEIASAIASYLTLFNSRCTQLILGAGATRSAGLKNITTKHLALAAQALSFISALIPHVREFIRRQAGTGTSVSTLMGDFDKVRRAYLEHQQSIYDKLIDIMAGRATAHAKSMKLINWEQKTGKDGPNSYMETLTKETSTLQRVLGKHLPEMTVLMIMEPVFKSYKSQWGKAFGDVVLRSEEAKERMLLDVEYFRTRVRSITGSGDTGDFLVDLVKEKQVLTPKTATPPPPSPAKETGSPFFDADEAAKDAKREDSEVREKEESDKKNKAETKAKDDEAASADAAFLKAAAQGGGDGKKA